MSCRQRIRRLEAYRRRRLPPSHFRMRVRVPWDPPAGMDQETWLAAEVRCPCGRRDCPGFRIGLVLPEKAPSAEAWADRAAAYYQKASAMSLKSRLDKLEQRAPRGGEHAPVMDIAGRGDAPVHVYRCACGDPACRQRPELRIVLHGRRKHAP